MEMEPAQQDTANAQTDQAKSKDEGEAATDLSSVPVSITAVPTTLPVLQTVTEEITVVTDRERDLVEVMVKTEEEETPEKQANLTSGREAPADQEQDVDMSEAV